MTAPLFRIGRIPFLAVSLAAPATVLAQNAPDVSFSERRWEEIVVVGSHLPRPAREVGSALTVFGRDDIAARQVSLTSELLREAPGVAVNRSGQVGAVTQVRIRGAEGNHTLVFIDGIEANDPVSGSEYNFADLMTWDLERVEVLRGPQSALYGSEAIGGVINVATLDPESGFDARGQVQAGSFGTTQFGGTVSGGSEAVRGLFSASRYDTDGISSSAIQPEDDGYENTTLHGKLQAELGDQVSARLVLRHQDNEVESDRQDFDFPPTPTQGLVVDSDGRTESSQLYGLLEVEARLLDDRWLHRARYGYTDTETDAYAGDTFTNGSRGERRKLGYETTFLLGDDEVGHALTGAIAREDLEFENRYVTFPGANQTQEDDQTSYVGEYALSFGNAASISLSVRHDDNDRFESATTYRATGSYLFDGSGSRLHASYGEGITNPTFTELFGFTPDTFIGNPELEPERSEGWDVGIEQSLFGGRALVDVTYFQADLQDEIITVFLPSFESTAVNQDGESKRDGIEVSASAQLDEAWSLNGTYTYLDATDPTGVEEVRRPRHSGSVDVNYAFLGGRGNVNLSALFNGEQEDSEFVSATPQTRVTLDSYTLVNLAVSFDVTDKVELFARGENLLDEDYTEVFGYRSPGAAGYVGVRARL